MQVFKDSVSQMQVAPTYLERWVVQNKMEQNAKNTKDMWITFKKSCPILAPINMGPTELKRISEFKLLGVYVQNELKWNTHVSSIYGVPLRSKYPDSEILFQKQKISRDVQNMMPKIITYRSQVLIVAQVH